MIASEKGGLRALVDIAVMAGVGTVLGAGRGSAAQAARLWRCPDKSGPADQ